MMTHLSPFLSSSPTHYDALVPLIHILTSLVLIRILPSIDPSLLLPSIDPSIDPDADNCVSSSAGDIDLKTCARGSGDTWSERATELEN